MTGITPLPDLPTFPARAGQPDQPGVFIPKLLAFYVALQNMVAEINAGGVVGGGSGSGDMLAANNLSDLVSAALARANLGVGNRIITAQIVGSALAASESLGAFEPPLGETWTLAANMAGAVGKKLAGGSNPGSTYTMTLTKNGSTVGSIAISTSGVVSFSTVSGAAVSYVGGTDSGQFLGSATPDAGAVGYVLTVPVSY